MQQCQPLIDHLKIICSNSTITNHISCTTFKHKTRGDTVSATVPSFGSGTQQLMVTVNAHVKH
jgi:hypothetical protein